ncbi:hypothetical protein K32_34730 [Kaistia sp. 32K]|nr:hypothetical protein K32_34730 [Kaistia sp. 32K]
MASLVSERAYILELIVIDDGSTDDTAAVARSSAAELGLPIVLASTNFRDAGSARNHGISRARGRWVYFLDADDTHEAGGLRALVAAGEGPQAPELVLGSYYIQRRDRDRSLFRHRPERLSAEEYLAGAAVVIVIGCGLILRSALDGQRFPGPLAYDEDTLFWAAMLACCRIAIVGAAVMTYHVSLQRSDERLVRDSRRSFEQWRRSLLALEDRGIRRVALGRREAFMGIRVARIHLRRGELADARHFLTLARRAPKTGADAYRWLRFRVKLAMRQGFGRPGLR